MNRRTLISVALAAMAAAPMGPGGALAQDAQSYPERPVTIVVPYSPGGSTDAVARFIVPILSEKLGQPFTVENKPGAAGTIGTDLVAKADPDGYTLLVHTSVIGIHPAFKSNLTYDTKADLAPVSIVATGPFVLNANPQLPVDNVDELVAYAKEHPGELNFGSAGAGSSGHLITELFMESTGTEMVHIPYAGGGPSQVGLMGNEVQIVFDTLTSVPFIEEGRLKALAVTSDERWAGLPDVPTMEEQGYGDAAAAIWIGAFAPAGTPDEIVQKVSDAIAEAVKSETVIEQLFNVGLVPVGSTPAEAKERLDQDIDRWQALADSGVTLE
ncbi:tripartite tricarboxylate transporter substrate binding protein [Chelativorans sp. AA-79]|uniref:Bug family tripartite tricarboxylate transporter substrate binding protein n=1 Tax=Chelativorans sp. AA-79 TaxID=3028735 RepID=UPI0023F9AD85|nr:tripartite tricarboxylate transporter substrate binding protein [Chelativorans sp. AA-79]WEX09039.1 tripartite tricarboxylate transporter substrate binding protein [Chelativorans sp. AA-79]